MTRLTKMEDTRDYRIHLYSNDKLTDVNVALDYDALLMMKKIVKSELANEIVTNARVRFAGISKYNSVASYSNKDYELFVGQNSDDDYWMEVRIMKKQG